MEKSIFLLTILAFLMFKNQAQTVTDIDGNVYNTVTIGSQVWLQENLKTTRYNNGELIGTTTPATFDIRPESTPKYQWAYEGNESKADTFGRLYTWYALIDSRGVCPTGWHVPADAEWTILTDFLGGTGVAGGKMKATGTFENGSGLWLYPNSYATNESNFSAIPAGYREDQGIFKEIRYSGYWWSSTELYANSAWRRRLDYDFGGVSAGVDFKKNGHALRCVKDTATQINDMNYHEKIKVFPNPVIDKIFISLSEEKNVVIQLYNILGMLVLQKELDNKVNEIDVSFLKQGLYLIEVVGTDWSVQGKLIKE